MHKLRTAIAVLMVLAPPAVFCQQTSPTRVEDNFYYRALFATLAEMNKQSAHMEDSIDYRRMIVEKNRNITEGLPAQLDEYRVEYLEPQELIDRYQKLRKPFPILVVFPMVNSGERMEVSFVLYWVSYRKNSLNYEMSDGSKVYFRYDCAKREYVLDEVRLSGI